MRILLGLVAVGLAASAHYAPRLHAERPGSLPLEGFVTDDPIERAAWGDEHRSLGSALSGYEEAHAASGDDELLRQRIRVGLLIGAVALGQPGLHELVRVQTTDYLERRGEIDPDGTFIRGVVREWLDERVNFDWLHRQGFYSRASASIYLSARRQEAGRKMLWTLVSEGRFYREFFPYVRRKHPSWPAVEPLVRHYLEKGGLGGLGGRVEAGVTLLDYYVLFGVGKELLDRWLPDIRDAIREMRVRLRSGEPDDETSAIGPHAILGLAMLANLGYPEERRALERAEIHRYGPVANVLRVAWIETGKLSFESHRPGSRDFDLLLEASDFYSRAAAHRAALIRRGLLDGKQEELARLLAILEAGFDGAHMPTRVYCLHALVAIDDELGQRLARRAVDERSVISVTAGVLLDDVKDRVAVFLPALMSPMPDTSALAAASLLDLDTGPALQR